MEVEWYGWGNWGLEKSRCWLKVQSWDSNQVFWHQGQGRLHTEPFSISTLGTVCEMQDWLELCPLQDVCVWFLTSDFPLSHVFLIYKIGMVIKPTSKVVARITWGNVRKGLNLESDMKKVFKLCHHVTPVPYIVCRLDAGTDPAPGWGGGNPSLPITSMYWGPPMY